MPDQATGLLSAFLRRRRISRAVPFLQGTVLDYGCGSGALAKFVRGGYTGIDIDFESLEIARLIYPGKRFVRNAEFLGHETRFDTIALLAVIEHMENLGEFLKGLRNRLNAGGRIVLTTPSPGFRWIHHYGSRIGLFSREANREHKNLLNKKTMQDLCSKAGLKIHYYKRFLILNQLFVLQAGDETNH